MTIVDQATEQVFKRCNICKELKPKTLEHFFTAKSKSKAGGRLFNSVCKSCSRKQNRDRAWGKYRKVIDDESLRHIRETVTECVICGATGVLHFDHCHATNRPRGMLCAACNHGIGKFLDDPELLEFAAEYLREMSYKPER